MLKTKIAKTFLEVFLFIWQLPQNVIGMFIGAFTRVGKKNSRGFYEWKLGSGISLGKFIFLNKLADDKSVAHEKGHQLQSEMLGPFYLLVVGLPSIIWCTLRMYGAFASKSYYSFYTEKWADKLGKVER